MSEPKTFKLSKEDAQKATNKKPEAKKIDKIQVLHNLYDNRKVLQKSIDDLDDYIIFITNLKE